MRFPLIALVLVLTVTLSTSAQQTAFGGGWDRVEALPAGTLVRVNSDQGSTVCRVTAVDANSAACGTRHVFSRTGIYSVQIPHRGRSTLVVTAIGAGVLGLFALFGKMECRSIGCEGALIVLGGLVAILSPVIGFFGDPTSTTIYKRPKA